MVQNPVCPTLSDNGPSKKFIVGGRLDPRDWAFESLVKYILINNIKSKIRIR
jgi:hypothetical protein